MMKNIDDISHLTDRINRSQLYERIKNNSYSDCERIVLGELIELKFNEDCIDVYKYTDLDNVDDDYDFDSDYITTIYY